MGRSKPVLVELHNIFVKDVEYFQTLVDSEPPGIDRQIARRAYLRSICALIDAMAFGLLDYIRETPWEPFLALSPAETKSLSERKQPTREALKLRLKICSKYAPWAHRVQFDGAGWQQLLDVFAVRNRITHPKDPAGAEIGESDLATVRDGAGWYIKEMQRFLGSLQDATRMKSHFGEKELEDWVRRVGAHDPS